MENKKIIEMIDENKIEELRKLIMQEICIKESKNKNTQKGLLTLSKIAKKEQKERPALAGAYFESGKTYICNGFWLIVANREIDGLEMAEKKNYDRPDFEDIIKNTVIDKEITIDKNIITIAKTNKENSVRVGSWLYQTKYAKAILDCFDSTANFYEFGNGLLIKDEEKTALLLKMREV